MGEDGQAEYLTRVEVYNLVRSGDAFQIALIGESAIPALKTLIDGGEYWEKTQAIEALSNIGTDKANRLLRATLDNPDWQVREFTLGVLKGKSISGLDRKIKEMAEKDPNVYVQVRAMKVVSWRKSAPLPVSGRKKELPDNIGNRKIGRAGESVQRI